MLLIDPASGKIQDANDAASRYYGHTVEALTQMQILQINALTPAEIRMEMQRAATCMPRMNGQEAYQQLRAIDPEVRVILAGGYSEQDIASQVAGKGLAGCLQKPYTLQNLRPLFHKLLPALALPKSPEHISVNNSEDIDAT